jgi:hypothetical protein
MVHNPSLISLAGFNGKNSAKKRTGKERIFRECTGKVVNKS